MPRGRPKQFEDEAVLRRAMEVFWRQGYDATTLEDLVEAMNIPRQSLYRTFSDKRTLFLRALDFYETTVASRVIQALEAEGPAIKNIETVFRGWSKALTDPKSAGCLIGNSFTQFLPDDDDVRQRLLRHQRRMVDSMRKALKRGQLEGDVSSEVDPKLMARTIIAAIFGLLSMSRMAPPSSIARDVLRNLLATVKA